MLLLIVLRWIRVAIQDASEVSAFSGSEEERVAEALLDAYRSGDSEAVQKCVASHAVFLELDNQVSPPSDGQARSLWSCCGTSGCLNSASIPRVCMWHCRLCGLQSGCRRGM